MTGVSLSMNETSGTISSSVLPSSYSTLSWNSENETHITTLSDVVQQHAAVFDAFLVVVKEIDGGGGGAVVISVRFCVYLFMIRHFLNGWKVQTTYKTQLSVNHFLNSGTTIVIWYALRKMFQSNKTELPLRARFRDKNSWSWVSTSCFTHFNLLIVLRVTALGRRRNLSFTILKQNERKGLQQFSSSHFATWKKYSDSRMWLLFHSRNVFGISSTAPQLMHLVKTGWRSIIIPDQISAAISPTCMKFSFSSSGAIVSLFKFRWDPNLSWGSTIPLSYWLNLTIQRSILLRELLPGLLVARENLSKSWVMK